MTEDRDALVRIFERSEVYPKSITSDSGTEFYNSKVSKLLKKNNIQHYSTKSKIKNDKKKFISILRLMKRLIM